MKEERRKYKEEERELGREEEMGGSSPPILGGKRGDEGDRGERNKILSRKSQRGLKNCSMNEVSNCFQKLSLF